jgi:hypothetical protein
LKHAITLIGPDRHLPIGGRYVPNLEIDCTN